MNPLLDSISKIFQNLRQNGIVFTGLKILHRFKIISVLHSFNFIYKKIESADALSAVRLKGVPLELREIKEQELERFHFAEGMFPIETFREHFHRGIRFFAAFRENTVIAVNGVHTRHAHLSYIKREIVRLPPGTVYINCALTSPVYRNLKVGTFLRTFLLNQLWNEGYQAITGAVFTENKSALRWNLTSGFKLWGRISYLQWMGHCFWLKQLSQVGRRFPHLFDNETIKHREELKKLTTPISEFQLAERK